MAKEMIVSVNGREKKIAILEDGKVTEFYIERGEENTGVVGNIYKGRVQRVLPGMQSAFVDIGLERDAFLYVSDFFDEEEEFERIVLEKAKKADVTTAEKVASERLQQARLEREQAMEAAQERAEPLIKTPPQTAAPSSRSKSSEKSTPAVVTEIPEEVPEEIASRYESDIKFESIVDDDDGESNFKVSETPNASVQQINPTVEFDNEAFVLSAAEDSAFERVIDDEENREETGDLFKEARIQERITDQVRAVEFEIEPTTNIEVGSFVLSNNLSSSFERVNDGEDEEISNQTINTRAAESKQARSTNDREKTASRTGSSRQRRNTKKTENTEEVASSTTEQTDEQNPQDKKKRRGASSAGKQASSKGETEKTRSSSRRASSNNDEGTSTVNLQSEARADDSNENGTPEQSFNNSENRSRLNESELNVGEGADRANQAVESSSSETRKNAESIETGESTSRIDDTNTETAVQTELETSSETSVVDAITEEYRDAEASVNDFGNSRSEFAVRRGGRRRRRRPQNAEGSDENSNAIEGDETSEDELKSSDGDMTAPDNLDLRGESGATAAAGAVAGSGGTAAAAAPPPPTRGNGHQQRSGNNTGSSNGGNRDRDRDRERDRRPPTITDLLREGQEILVQIAKEPIAKKGARITSHIALPGRYLVYMPTIEHVGVSRKIESGNERNRLRIAIQKIRNEEDVPSGGFIVRTAGIGIPEEDLRNDARYLVRTWQDIRKQAEKVKSPALVHQDLDLVQRILRDQLSENFAAIRVDDEAEYLRTVEFINRIQPRLTNRVKLYTRDEPIMEHYGVQEEVEKAIKPRVWLKSGGYLVINQTEALVSIDVNTGKFVGKGATRLEDTITKTNMEAVEEIARQIRLRDLGGIIVLDLIDMEDRKNRQRVLQTLQEALQGDKSPTKVLSFNDFGLIVMTRKRVKQSLERTLCAPCHYCQGAGLIKSPQTIVYEVLAEARRLSKQMDDGIKQTTLRVHPEIAKALRSTETDVLVEIEDYLGAVDVTSDASVHQEQFDFAFV